MDRTSKWLSRYRDSSDSDSNRIEAINRGKLRWVQGAIFGVKNRTA